MKRKGAKKVPQPRLLNRSRRVWLGKLAIKVMRAEKHVNEPINTITVTGDEYSRSIKTRSRYVQFLCP